ncbi:MAG: energy-coupling factor ABC transporter permease [Anaerolineaceae bacterium]|nr:energy-coupling factor ABC transporter permease [Anaerolineaceae bacterium]
MFAAPLPMHIPDGFLSVAVSIVFWVISVIVIGISLARVNRDLGERQVPVMGVLAAAIFAGQMLNFSVTGGTSGHLLGAALATILLGPWAAVLVMTCVVAIQALIFQDGGLLVLGANLFNMAILGPFVAYPVYKLIQRISGGKPWGVFVGGGVAAWASILVASLSCAFQIALSGTSPANVAIPAMAGIHALIGLGEALITVGALSLVYAARRDLLQTGSAQPVRNNTAVWVGGSLLTLALVILSPLASSNPDGLEWVAEQAGFLETARDPSYNIIPDYVLPGISNEATATILAGVVGAFIVLAAALALAYARRKRSA